MPIPPPLIPFLIYMKDLTSEQQASSELGEFHKIWTAKEIGQVDTFLSHMARLSEAECREAHVTDNPILDAEIVKVKSVSLLYSQIAQWLREAKTRLD